MQEYIAELFVGTLVTALLLLIRRWDKTWETRMIAQDKRLDGHDNKHVEHDVNHAVLKANLEHIRANTDEMKKDVKDILRQNGNRSTG